MNCMKLTLVMSSTYLIKVTVPMELTILPSASVIFIL